jgi:hypothetical protein
LLTFDDSPKKAVAEHVWEVFQMPVEKSTRWSGLAAALGGSLFVYSMSYGYLEDDFSLLWTLLPTAVLWAVALTNLYRRLPASTSSGNKATFGFATISLLLLVVGVFSFSLSNPDLPWYLLGIGFFGLAIGIVGMGIIILAHRVLGIWRFVPLGLGGVFLGFMVVNTIAGSPQQLALALLFLTGIGWLLLGAALWQEQRTPRESGVLA